MLFDHYPLITPLKSKNDLANTQLWLASDPILQKKVVIKQLLPQFSPLQYQQFYQEYQTYQALRNLNPIEQSYFFNFLDAQMINEKNWLTFEHYHGQTLTQANVANCLTFFQKIEYLTQLCHAIEIFHSQGFIHCDIKPSNVFIIQNQLKLFDFGLTTTSRDLSYPQITAGTPAYMSPEQFTGGCLTYQSDYYSLGILMYESLIGRKPYVADNLENWAIRHCQTPVPKVTGFSNKITHQLDALFHQLLAKFPRNRPKTLLPILYLLKNLKKV